MGVIYTIGAYGFTGDSFVAALRRDGVDSVVDVRLRRGMRGPDYAWANARRLEARLAREGIAYRPMKELAPTPEIRAVQHVADEALRQEKRTRSELSQQFHEAYFRAILMQRDAGQTAARLRDSGSAPALFCVERLPEACHRSIVSDWLWRDGAVSEVVHLVP